MGRLTVQCAPFAFIAVATAGCSTWRQVTVSPTVLEGSPAEVQVTRNDGTRLTLASPRIDGDSLSGVRAGRHTTLALDDVRRMALPTPATAKNSAIVTFTVVTLGVALGWLAFFSISQ